MKLKDLKNLSSIGFRAKEQAGITEKKTKLGLYIRTRDTGPLPQSRVSTDLTTAPRSESRNKLKTRATGQSDAAALSAAPERAGPRKLKKRRTGHPETGLARSDALRRPSDAADPAVSRASVVSHPAASLTSLDRALRSREGRMNEVLAMEPSTPAPRAADPHYLEEFDREVEDAQLKFSLVKDAMRGGFIRPSEANLLLHDIQAHRDDRLEGFARTALGEAPDTSPSRVNVAILSGRIMSLHAKLATAAHEAELDAKIQLVKEKQKALQEMSGGGVSLDAQIAPQAVDGAAPLSPTSKPIETKKGLIGVNRHTFGQMDIGETLVAQRQSMHTAIAQNVKQVQIYRKDREKVRVALENNDHSTLAALAVQSGAIRGIGAGVGVIDLFLKHPDFKTAIGPELSKAVQAGKAWKARYAEEMGKWAGPEAFDGIKTTDYPTETILEVFDTGAEMVANIEKAVHLEIERAITAGTPQEQRANLSEFLRTYSDAFKSTWTPANRKAAIKLLGDATLVGTNKIDGISRRTQSIGCMLEAREVNNWLQSLTLATPPGAKVQKAMLELDRAVNESQDVLDHVDDRPAFKAATRTPKEAKHLADTIDRLAKLTAAVQDAVDAEAGKKTGLARTMREFPSKLNSLTSMFGSSSSSAQSSRMPGKAPLKSQIGAPQAQTAMMTPAVDSSGNAVTAPRVGGSLTDAQARDLAQQYSAQEGISGSTSGNRGGSPEGLRPPPRRPRDLQRKATVEPQEGGAPLRGRDRPLSAFGGDGSAPMPVAQSSGLLDDGWVTPDEQLSPGELDMASAMEGLAAHVAARRRTGSDSSGSTYRLSDDGQDELTGEIMNQIRSTDGQIQALEGEFNQQARAGGRLPLSAVGGENFGTPADLENLRSASRSPRSPSPASDRDWRESRFGDHRSDPQGSRFASPPLSPATQASYGDHLSELGDDDFALSDNEDMGNTRSASPDSSFVPNQNMQFLAQRAAELGVESSLLSPYRPSSSASLPSTSAGGGQTRGASFQWTPGTPAFGALPDLVEDAQAEAEAEAATPATPQRPGLQTSKPKLSESTQRTLDLRGRPGQFAALPRETVRSSQALSSVESLGSREDDEYTAGTAAQASTVGASTQPEAGLSATRQGEILNAYYRNRDDSRRQLRAASRQFPDAPLMALAPRERYDAIVRFYGQLSPALPEVMNAVGLEYDLSGNPYNNE